jgi:uncharacterized protein YgbK (DUF1537 family)
MNDRPKIIVLDDDPTGSQTVHSCLLLTQWDFDTLKLGLADPAPIVFILTNTRALSPQRAAAVTQEVCDHLKLALQTLAIDNYLIVSRSDSTLRGHYPIETDTIDRELGPFDAHFLIPAFFEGGRITRDSIHYLIINGTPTPVHETEFARDSVFSYSHSYLPDYVAEKTENSIPADRVERFLLPEIRSGCLDRLLNLTNNCCGVIDGEIQTDFDRFAADLLTATARGKKFLLRSAASILTSLANLGPQPIAAEAMSTYVRNGRPGAIIVGSHVRKTTIQLEQLLKLPNIVGLELDLSKLLVDFDQSYHLLLQSTIDRAATIHQAEQTPVIYTSRQELTFDDVATRLDFGERVSALLMEIERNLPPTIGFLISKGGITSNDTLSQGLALPAARLLGQILPGCSIVITPPNHPLFPNLPVVLFPGNVGDDFALATVYQRISGLGSGGG